jgi:hypothetical protein
VLTRGAAMRRTSDPVPPRRSWADAAAHARTVSAPVGLEPAGAPLTPTMGLVPAPGLVCGLRSSRARDALACFRETRPQDDDGEPPT